MEAGEILQIWTTYTSVLVRKKLCFMFDAESLFLCWPKTEVWYLALLKAKRTLQKSESLMTGRRLKLSPRPSGAQVWSSDFLRPSEFTLHLLHLLHPPPFLPYLPLLAPLLSLFSPWFSSPLFSQEAMFPFIFLLLPPAFFPSAHQPIVSSRSTSYPRLGET